MKLITKSNFLIGLNCPRCFWKAINETDNNEASLGESYRIEQGRHIGNIAKRLYADGIDLEGMPFEKNLEVTLENIQERNTIFEAGFLVDNLYARVDILVPNNDNTWNIVEVKSSTKIKEEHYYDVAFQKYVLKNSGVNIDKCCVIHVNNKYIRNVDINLQEYFNKEDITDTVDAYLNKIHNIVEKLIKIVQMDMIPEIKPEPYMDKKYPCDFKEECWGFLPDNNVTELYNMNTKAIKFISKGIFKIQDAPDAMLNEKQLIQKQAIVNDEKFINKIGIKEFLDNLQYPLYYFDFETFSEVVPRFNGDKPNKQIPFQFSLHIQNENGDIEHFEYLHKESTDPRAELIKEMKKLLGDKGSIIVFNQGFEKRVLRELAEVLPEYSGWVNGILERITDLIIPFRNFDYYNPLQKGSCSIKKVLPAVTGKGYDDLEIGNGEDAFTLYLKATYDENIERENIYNNLLKYCKLDTEGMVWIVKELRNMI